jgi:toxin CptA
MHSSSAFSPCRIELRPSRWLVAALAALAALAPVSLWASALPRPLFWPLALVSAAAAVALVVREARRPPLELAIEAPDRVLIDRHPISELHVEWRGPLAFLRWRDGDGRCHTRSLWPDTLPPPLRRELRLALAAAAAAAARDPGRGPGAMAP